LGPRNSSAATRRADDQVEDKAIPENRRRCNEFCAEAHI